MDLQLEGKIALVSGADGLEATRALLDGAGRVLAPGGLLALEIDATGSGWKCSRLGTGGRRSRQSSAGSSR